MDNRPVGVFDSGLGGLTAVRELRLLLPNESIIYFGDTARVPYGTRSRETLLRYVKQDIGFLRTFDLKTILVACGTASTTVLESVRDDYDLPIFGVVEPSAAAAVEASATGRIGLIGTPATVRSGAFERRIRQLKPEAQVFSVPCPLLVPLVENGRTSPDDPVLQLVLAEYLAHLQAQDIDALILGCTHYPLLSEAIARQMGPAVHLIDSGAAIAQHTAATLQRQGTLADGTQCGSLRCFVSDQPHDFARLASLFLRCDTEPEVSRVDIEQY